MTKEGAPRNRRPRTDAAPARDSSPRVPLTGMNRREMLAGLFGTGAAAVVAANAKELRAELEAPEDAPVAQGEEVTPTQEEMLDLELEKAKPQSFDTGQLAGHRIGGLFVAYLGNPKLAESALHHARHARHGHHEAAPEKADVIPEKLSLNYPRAMHAFWQRKLELLHDASKTNLDVETDAYERTMEYARRWNYPEQYSGLDQALGRAGLLDTVESLKVRMAAIKSVLTAPTGLAFFEESRHYQIRTEDQAATFAGLVNRLSASMVTSYAMTELLPSADGDFNVRFYDFLLSTAGKEFLAGIPSLGDLVESIGQYQGTHWAVKDTSAAIPNWSDTKIQREGASVPNAILPSAIGIPKDIGSIYNFEDHSAMAFLYAVNIIGQTISKLSGPNLARFRACDDQTFVSFIATSHNNPSKAFKALESHLHSIAAGHPVSYAECCGIKIREYSVKTDANYAALKKAEKEYGGKKSGQHGAVARS